MSKPLTPWRITLWIIISLFGASSFAFIGFFRGETISSLWIITAAVCTYLIGYRFYSAWVCAKVLTINPQRKTPAEKFRDGRDYEPTNKWIVFGHHFAAIAGPGPLIGPTLAAQFGYLPSMLWILIGSVIGGCVQDLVILFFSVRHDGKTLCQMAKDELGKFGGFAAITGIMLIMIILISVLGLVVVNAMKHSAWATSTVFFTIPIAVFIGIYMRFFRPGAVLEASILGFALLILAVFGGKWIGESALLKPLFEYDGKTLAFSIMVYGFVAAVLPVWMLLAPRDYLSTFLKLGTISLLAIAIIALHPEIKMPAFTQFTNGDGPIFAGKIFPFVFITIACGAISGFHSLIASGTTPKLISNEKDIRMVGYGSMILESFVALMALIAACIMEPGTFFAINSPAGIVGKTAAEAVQTINSWGFSVSLAEMEHLAKQIGEETLFNRTGGAPSLAVGMATIFSKTFGDGLLSIWYHFIIMFEAVFILTTLDAGTRVCRFMLQDVLGGFYKPLGRTSWYPSVLLTSLMVVSAWGYFLYNGVIDPNGGVNILWPLFGIANQILAAMALAIATVMIIKSRKFKYFWVTILPLAWLSTSTLTAAWQKLFSDNVRIGLLAGARDLQNKFQNNLLPEEKMALAPKLILNQYVVAGLTAFFALLLLVVIFDMTRIVIKKYKLRHVEETL
ncbi:MAG: carbon starvation protein CstA [Rickettsiaceae bacterium]|jgi:carbon starvation protein|nr:carbon starvation protein CstA [Rickettsiaceae bacterium]